MLFYPYLALYILCGILSIRWLLPGQKPLIRIWLGSTLGLFYLMWLPALVAFVYSFSLIGHLVAIIPLLLLSLAAYLLRDKMTLLQSFGNEDLKDAKILLLIALPLTLLGGYLQYTHNLRPINGALFVGQSTYGDLALHTGIATSLRNASFPADYSILPGVQLSYPFLSDSLSTSGLLLGLNLQSALNIPGTVMMALVFSGFSLFSLQLCSRRRVAVLAILLLFINGGLGFIYSFDMMGQSLGTTGQNQMQLGSWLDRLNTILTGWYQTPVNHAEFTTYNLRWSNIIADMLIPQRSFLAGWVYLFPCLYLLYDSLASVQRNWRTFALLGLLAGGLPLIHTHSFLALGLVSIGWFIWDIVKNKAFKSWFVYGGIALLLALPQLVFFTFSQSSSEGFLRVQFNWVNNSGGAGLRDGYIWFYMKNIGLPFLLLILSLFDSNKKSRFIYTGAFVIFIVSEFIIFQPNEYDNNKLLYVWYALCLIPISEYTFVIWDKLKGLKARPLIGTLACLLFFLSGWLSIARETVSSYEAYSPSAVAAGRFAEDETPQHSTFMAASGNHLNPVSALAGRNVVCGPSLWLHWHGFDLSEREKDIQKFYQQPQNNISILNKYSVDYILYGPSEKALTVHGNESLDALFEEVFADETEDYRIYKVSKQ